MMVLNLQRNCWQRWWVGEGKNPNCPTFQSRTMSPKDDVDVQVLSLPSRVQEASGSDGRTTQRSRVEGLLLGNRKNSRTLFSQIAQNHFSPRNFRRLHECAFPNFRHLNDGVVVDNCCQKILVYSPSPKFEACSKLVTSSSLAFRSRLAHASRAQAWLVEKILLPIWIRVSNGFFFLSETNTV